MKRALNELYVLPAAFYEDLVSVSTKHLIYRRDILLKEDQFSKYFYFLHYGAIRFFWYDGTKQVTAWIFTAGQVVFIPKRFLRADGSSIVNVEVLSDAQVSVVSAHQFEQLGKKHAGAKELGRQVCERFRNDYEDYLLMISRSCDERYDYLMERFPDLRDSRHIGVLAPFVKMSRSTYYRCLGRRVKG